MTARVLILSSTLGNIRVDEQQPMAIFFDKNDIPRLERLVAKLKEGEGTAFIHQNILGTRFALSDIPSMFNSVPAMSEWSGGVRKILTPEKKVRLYNERVEDHFHFLRRERNFEGLIEFAMDYPTYKLSVKETLRLVEDEEIRNQLLAELDEKVHD